MKLCPKRKSYLYVYIWKNMYQCIEMYKCISQNYDKIMYVTKKCDENVTKCNKIIWKNTNSKNIMTLCV